MRSIQFYKIKQAKAMLRSNCHVEQLCEELVVYITESEYQVCGIKALRSTCNNGE